MLEHIYISILTIINHFLTPLSMSFTSTKKGKITLGLAVDHYYCAVETSCEGMYELMSVGEGDRRWDW